MANNIMITTNDEKMITMADINPFEYAKKEDYEKLNINEENISMEYFDPFEYVEAEDYKKLGIVETQEYSDDKFELFPRDMLDSYIDDTFEEKNDKKRAERRRRTRNNNQSKRKRVAATWNVPTVMAQKIDMSNEAFEKKIFEYMSHPNDLTYISEFKKVIAHKAVGNMKRLTAKKVLDEEKMLFVDAKNKHSREKFLRKRDSAEKLNITKLRKEFIGYVEHSEMIEENQAETLIPGVVETYTSKLTDSEREIVEAAAEILGIPPEILYKEADFYHLNKKDCISA